MPTEAYSAKEVAELLDTVLTTVQSLKEELRNVLSEVHEKEWYTPREFAGKTGLGYFAVMDRIKTGKLKTDQPGGIKGRHRINRAELSAHQISKTTKS